MKLSELARLRKEMKKSKEEHMPEMIKHLEKTRDFILVTDKFTAMCGTTDDTFKLIHKMFSWLFERTPREVHLIYADYLEDLVKEIRNNK